MLTVHTDSQCTALSILYSTLYITSTLYTVQPCIVFFQYKCKITNLKESYTLCKYPKTILQMKTSFFYLLIKPIQTGDA